MDRRSRSRSTVWVLALMVVVAACGGGSERTTQPDGPLGDGRCVVWIHGRSDRGAPPELVGGVAMLSPDGNAEYDDGFEWRYETPERLEQAASIVGTTLDAAGCDRAVLAGFSNGAAFVGALYCGARTFGDRVVGVVVDDPVTDEAVIGCSPATETPVALYWTGALGDVSTPGTSCERIGFTCAGETLIGIDAYADALGVAPTASAFTEHRWYRDAPVIDEWLGP